MHTTPGVLLCVTMGRMKSPESPSEHEESPESPPSEQENASESGEYGTPVFDLRKVNEVALRKKVEDALEEAREEKRDGDEAADD